MLASQQELSGVQLASYLMNWEDHYKFQDLFLIQTEKFLQAQPAELDNTRVRARLRMRLTIGMTLTVTLTLNLRVFTFVFVFLYELKLVR